MHDLGLAVSALYVRKLIQAVGMENMLQRENSFPAAIMAPTIVTQDIS